MSIKRPLFRPARPDIISPTVDDMLNLALSRMHHIVSSDPVEPPPLLFPLAESMKWDHFTYDDWDRYSDLETEQGRLTYTLSTYPERGAPAACEDDLKHLLTQTSILEAWTGARAALQANAVATVNGVASLHRNGGCGSPRTNKLAYVTLPIDYEPSPAAPELSLQLWKRSVREMAERLVEGSLLGRIEFLQIHAFLKDPIYWFAKPFEVQSHYFIRLVSRLRDTIQSGTLSMYDYERLAAQAAQESAFLANPLLDKLTLIHFHAHHQLPYVNVPIDSLARAEFAVPAHVLEVAEEILRASAVNDGYACPLVPILIACRPSFSDHTKSVIPLIDGNHRATAVHFLRFLSQQPPLLEAHSTMSQRLHEYCKAHKLGPKWQVDLEDVLDQLYVDSTESQSFINQLLASSRLLRNFATVENVPALVVQEEDFHTICKQRSVGKDKPVLLHPFHQTLFNDDDLPFALPQKAGQTHGRPEAFRLLPLTPFGPAQDGLGMKNGEPLKADLRQSQVGLIARDLVATGKGQSAEIEATKIQDVHTKGAIAT